MPEQEQFDPFAPKYQKVGGMVLQLRGPQRITVRRFYREVVRRAVTDTWRFWREHLLVGVVALVLGFAFQFVGQGATEAIAA